MVIELFLLQEVIFERVLCLVTCNFNSYFLGVINIELHLCDTGLIVHSPLQPLPLCFHLLITAFEQISELTLLQLSLPLTHRHSSSLFFHPFLDLLQILLLMLINLLMVELFGNFNVLLYYLFLKCLFCHYFRELLLDLLEFWMTNTLCLLNAGGELLLSVLTLFLQGFETLLELLLSPLFVLLFYYLALFFQLFILLFYCIISLFDKLPSALIIQFLFLSPCPDFLLIFSHLNLMLQLDCFILLSFMNQHLSFGFFQHLLVLFYFLIDLVYVTRQPLVRRQDYYLLYRVRGWFQL